VAEAGRHAVEAIRAADPEALIVYDVPLLYETGMQDRFDAVVVIYVPRHEQQRRLMTRDALSQEAAEARISSQMDIEEKARRAEHVITNTGTFEELRERVTDLVRRLQEEQVRR
jgi:dephospho-CoA kinase